MTTGCKNFNNINRLLPDNLEKSILIIVKSEINIAV